jgi:iron complex transport system substrate-binding protein
LISNALLLQVMFKYHLELDDLDYTSNVIEMNKKIITTITVIVTVFVAIAGTYVLTSNSGGQSPIENSKGDCNLWVYGNVNGDDYIDQRDIDLLEDIIAGNAYEVYVTVYDGYNASNSISRISFADANQDGKIDQKDIEYIKEIIEYQEKYSDAVSKGTLSSFDEELTLYYNNCDNVTASVDLPVKSLISMYFSNSEVVRLLGAVDRVVATDNNTLSKATLLPEFQGLMNLGDRKEVSSEAVLSTNADAYFTGSASTYSPYLEETCGEQIDIIRLSAWEDNNVMVGTLTLGYILGCTDKAYEYIDWCNKYIDIVTEGVSKVQGNVTVIVPKGRGNSLEGNGLGSGQFEISEMAGAINVAAGLPTTSEYPDFTQEWALRSNIQFIILSGYCGFEFSSSDVETKVTGVVQEAYNTYFGTPAASNGQIYFIANEIFTGPSNIVSMVYCAKWFYPELFESLDGTAVFQEYLDKFCPSLADYDLESHLDQFILGPSKT